jgi:molybdopterin/thiamine biosynthesis adenylyltransferase
LTTPCSRAENCRAVTAATTDRKSMKPTVAVVGVGGLGCPAAWALARAGVALRLLDEDRVERSNLHRQMLFTDADVGDAKVRAARRALLVESPGAEVEAIAEHVAPEGALRLLGGASVVVEGSDNLATKFLVADACAALGIPVVHGACVGWVGTVLPVSWGAGPCYRCVFEDLPPADDEAATCATAGVYGPITSVVGALMAADALRLLAGDRSTLGALARYDGWAQTFRATTLRRRRGCPLCGDAAGAITLDPSKYGASCADP